MLEVTPQERSALIVLAVLLTGGAAARQITGSEGTAGIQYTAEADDTLSPKGNSALRARVESELSESRMRSEPLVASEKLDPNVADAVQLDRLPGVGPALADRIVAFRSANGRFRTLGDLSQVPGIGPALLTRISSLVSLPQGGPSSSDQAGGNRVDINRGTEAELQTLPGIGPAIAARIVEYRSANGSFQRWEDLEKVPGIGPRLRARIQAVARLGS